MGVRLSRSSSSIVVALAGPNGAGKSTAGPALLRETLRITEFVNADVIARGLSAFAPEKAAFAAGRAMISRMQALAKKRVSFAFETTLAGRSHAVWIRRLVESGYEFHLFFLWLPTAEFAVERVRDRVRLGGHAVPEETVRRRYRTGIRNFFRIYRPLAASWRLYDNSSGPVPTIIAVGSFETTRAIEDRIGWERIEQSWRE